MIDLFALLVMYLLGWVSFCWRRRIWCRHLWCGWWQVSVRYFSLDNYSCMLQILSVTVLIENFQSHYPEYIFFASRIINFPVINLFPLCCQIWPLCLFIFISGLKAIQLILLQMNKKRWASLNLVFIKYLYWECLTTWFQNPIDLLQLCFCSSTSTAHIYFFKFWSIFFICSWQDDDDYSTTIMHPSRNTYTAPTALLNDIARSSENVSKPQQCLTLVSNLFIIL